MSSRIMSDAEIRRRKKLQGHISETTGALGLTALGITGLRSKGGQKALKAGFSTIGRKRPGVLKPKKLEGVNTAVLSTGAGIGGAGSFNFASYTNAEGRKRKQTVAKMGDWKTIDQREMQQRRSRKAMRQAGVGAGAGVGLMAASHKMGGTRHLKPVVQVTREGLNHPEVSTQDALLRGKAALKGAMHTSGEARLMAGGAALLAGSAAVGTGAKVKHTYDQHKINQRRRSKFKKSDDVSAFGVRHTA